MRVLFVSSEMAPYAKSGGLGDVIGALPDALSNLGVEAHVLMPLYRCVKERFADELTPAGFGLNLQLGSDQVSAELVLLKRSSGVKVWFLDIPHFYDREGLYGEGDQLYPDAFARFITLSKAAVALAELLKPDILHANDWFTAFSVVSLKEHAQKAGKLLDTRAVFTIHNLAYQGIFWYYDWHMLNLPDELFHYEKLEYYGHINLLKGGIVWADAVNTVSPSYAEEIKTEEHGCGLDGVLRHYSNKLVGILNGIDTNVWNPRTDPFLEHHYDTNDLSGKAACRKELLDRFGLKASKDTAVIGMIGRLVEQKGWEIVRRAVEQMLELDAVFVILGKGDPEIELWLEGQREWFPERFGVKIGFDESLAHLITAGADLFLMPSRFEPCGLNQMYALNYGTPVVAHATGGLKDTIIDVRKHPPEGTGWLFETFSPDALVSALAEAISFRQKNPEAFRAMMLRGMAQDFSWERSAKAYLGMYRSVLGME